MARSRPSINTYILLPHAKAQLKDTSLSSHVGRAAARALLANNIESWAIRNGWKLGAAKELAKLAGKIGALKSKPELGRFHNLEGRYESWKR